jgi:hypothetical protein
MTRATAEVFGLVEECTDEGLIRIANINFLLPEGESASVGQFIRASLSWNSESLWDAKEVSVYDADPSHDPTVKQVAQEVAQAAITNAQQQAITAPAPQAPAPTTTKPTPAKPTGGFSGFSKPAAQAQPSTPAPTPAAVPLRAPPPTAVAAPAAQKPANAAAPASRFAGFGAKTGAAAPAAQAAKPAAAPTSQPAAAAAKPTSRFGAALGTKVVSISRPGTAAPARPAFDPMADYSDEDIPF